LISALQKIEAAPHHARGQQRDRTPVARPALAGAGRANDSMEKLFSTHPPIQERIKRLQEM
jgi:Zn-dependent protease with chaperone function